MRAVPPSRKKFRTPRSRHYETGAALTEAAILIASIAVIAIMSVDRVGVESNESFLKVSSHFVGAGSGREEAPTRQPPTFTPPTYTPPNG